MALARRGLLRLIDANANRTLEGLRVCEDIVRLYLESPRAFRRLRALRHSVANAVSRLPVTPVALLSARHSGSDIGRRAPGTRIASVERLLLINFQRAKESLRVLEECSRVFGAQQTAVFQHLRFRAYDVERDALLAVAALRHH